MMGRRKRPIAIASAALCKGRSNGPDIHDEGRSRRRHKDMKMTGTGTALAIPGTHCWGPERLRQG